MKLFKKMKDGGPLSTVVGYWLVEWKSLFSVCLLNFQGKSREAFHTHAFHCISWVIKGELKETMLDGRTHTYKPSWKPFLTTRKDFHKVDSVTDNTWLFTIRGPWVKRWKEFHPETGANIELTEGRKVVSVN